MKKLKIMDYLKTIKLFHYFKAEEVSVGLKKGCYRAYKTEIRFLGSYSSIFLSKSAVFPLIF